MEIERARKLVDLLVSLGMERVQAADELTFQKRATHGDVLVQTSMRDDKSALGTTDRYTIQVFGIPCGADPATWMGQVSPVNTDLNNEVLHKIAEASRFNRDYGMRAAEKAVTA